MTQGGNSLVVNAIVGVGSASLAALALLLPAARPWRGRAASTRPWGAPLALGVATCAGFGATRGWPSLPPGETLEWLFYLAILAAAYGTYEALSMRPRLPARALCAVLVPLVVLAFQREHHWGRAQGVAWTGGLAVWLFLTWQALSAHERRVKGGAPTLGLAMAGALAAASYGLAGGGLYAQLAGALALALGACALLGLWRHESGLGVGGVATFVLLHFALVWLARYLYELSAAGFVLLSLAPLGVWLSACAPAARPRLRAALALAGPTLLAATALALEFAAAPPPSPYG